MVATQVHQRRALILREADARLTLVCTEQSRTILEDLWLVSKEEPTVVLVKHLIFVVHFSCGTATSLQYFGVIHGVLAQLRHHVISCQLSYA